VDFFIKAFYSNPYVLALHTKKKILNVLLHMKI